MNIFWILFSVTMLCVGAFLAVRVTKGGVIAMLIKTLASVCFMVTAFVGVYLYGMSLENVFILIGLLFGLIGDVVLDLKYCHREYEYLYTNSGMLSFGFGHVMYFVTTMLVLGTFTNIAWAYVAIAAIVAVILTIVITFISKKLKFDFGKLFYQTIAYTFILTFMVAITIITTIHSGAFWKLMLGIILIFLSDLVLSSIYFGGQENNKLMIIVNHVIYYAGQLMICMYLFA